MRVIRIAIAIGALALAGAAVAQPLLSKSQAKAIVRDVNLKAADMKGYDVDPPQKPTAEGRRSDNELTRCAHGVPLSRALAWGTSPLFSRGNLDDYAIVVSSVVVFPKATQLRKDLAAMRSVRWRDCVRTQIIESGASGGFVATVKVTTLRTDVAGAFGYRFKIDASTTDGTRTTYTDIFFMGTRTSVARVSVNSSPSEPTQKQDDDVLRIINTRLQARANPNAIL